MTKETIKTEELRVEGFHCADCAVTIEQTMAKLGGVESVKANFAAGKVKVDYDPVQLGHDDWFAVLRKSVTRLALKRIKTLKRSRFGKIANFFLQ